MKPEDHVEVMTAVQQSVLAPSVYIAIFGARVMPDGSPSGSLSRRIEGAYQCSLRQQQQPCFFVSGGTSDLTIPTEAAVMARVLMAKGVASSHLVQDHQSSDTLDSVLIAAKVLSKQIPILVCSDNYHVLRITILLRMVGFKAKPVWISSGRAATGNARWCYMWFRDLVATLYDSLLLSYHLLRKE
ncbi:YdcF family protein [Rheinheimera riviphila]|uniref:YdcF family protein n=1 Tax=Rheinheimera riviphila TaxID=1834037 RepID=A0A437QRF8_9GAMM|nr:YdcF family protein [Rheinheimera riviphila]RVU37096.1 YdcF family protein [Rheinheimera riviphila]